MNALSKICIKNGIKNTIEGEKTKLIGIEIQKELHIIQLIR